MTAGRPRSGGADPDERFAFIGVRSCELHAIAIQDKVFLGGAHVDPLIGRAPGRLHHRVNCGQAGGTCFCVSMNTGQKPRQVSISLDRGRGDRGHIFVVEAATDAGLTVLARCHTVWQRKRSRRRRIGRDADRRLHGREMHSDDVHELLLRNLENPVGTMSRSGVSPALTALCLSNLLLHLGRRFKRPSAPNPRALGLDSCFTMDFSYIHAQCARQLTLALSPVDDHKLATWLDQFARRLRRLRRCITWCPVASTLPKSAGNPRQRAALRTKRWKA